MEVIYIAFIPACDKCGSNENLGKDEFICAKCKQRLRKRDEKDRVDAIEAFMSNHPGQPLPSCFLPVTIETQDRIIFSLDAAKKNYVSLDTFWSVCDVTFETPVSGMFSNGSIFNVKNFLA